LIKRGGELEQNILLVRFRLSPYMMVDIMRIQRDYLTPAFNSCLLGVAACLAVTDHTSQYSFSKYLGRPLCFAKSPAAFVAHTFLFIFSGVALYCGLDSAFNPAHEGRRVEELKSGLYSTYIGANTAWYEPYVAPSLAKLAGPTIASTWLGSALLPATLAYSTVKGNDGREKSCSFVMHLSGSLSLTEFSL
jgi:hypothetical protein